MFKFVCVNPYYIIRYNNKLFFTILQKYKLLLKITNFSGQITANRLFLHIFNLLQHGLM